MDYYNNIKEKLIKNESYIKVKEYSKNRHILKTYYEVGKLLSEAGKHYGENIIGKYSEKLIIEVGKKYNKRTLFRIRQFYDTLCNEKVSTLSTQLTWSHYSELLLLKDINQINYYINQTIKRNLDVRSLRKKIKEKEYERLDESTKEKIKHNEELSLIDEIKDPILIKNKKDNKNISEYELKQLILDHLDEFLSQLGAGYCYISNEYKIKVGDRYNYIDILLFNIKYNCYVVLELKVTELKKEYVGQTKFYMNYIDENIKEITHNKTRGIIIVKENNKYVIKYLFDKNIKSIEYQLI